MPNPNKQAAVKKPPRERKTGPPPEIDIKVSWCKSCGLCVEYCNRGVLEMDGHLPTVVRADRCSRCLQCEDMCPDFAITVKDSESAEEAPEREES